jgi:uncharacterized RDD family membrane protein YckC
MSTYPQQDGPPGAAIVKLPTQVLGRRVVAQILDGLAISIIVWALGFGVYNLEIRDGTLEGDLGAFWASYAGVVFLYYFLFEWLFGATIGKLLCGIRVREADGHRAGFIRVLVRTILRIIDVLPTAYLLGWFVALVSGKDRRGRIGDLVGGTYVVRE